MLKKIRSKDVVDIFLNKAVGDFQLCELIFNEKFIVIVICNK